MAQTTSDRDNLYEAAMECQRPRDAQRILSALVLEAMQTHEPHIGQEAATNIVKANLAYMAGYHDHATRRRVETMFQCVHPYLGPALKHPPDPDECFKLGEEMGKSGKFEARWEQPTDNLPPEHQLLLENVYQFREMLDQCYDHIDVLKGKLKSLEAPATRIKELEEENLRLRVALKSQALKIGESDGR